MEIGSTIIGIISAIAGGGLGSFFTYKTNASKQNSSEFEILVQEYKDIVSALKIEVTALRTEVDDVKLILEHRNKEIVNLRNQLIIFESSHSDVPVPIWLKDTNGKMLFLNPDYEQKILVPLAKTSEDYIGKTDYEVWDKKTSDQFKRHDREVMRKKVPVRFIERWKGQNGVVLEGELIKYPRFLNKTIVGIGGIIIDVKIILDATNQQ